MFNQAQIIHHFDGPGVKAQFGYNVVTAAQFPSLDAIALQCGARVFNHIRPKMTVEWTQKETYAYFGGSVGEWSVPRAGNQNARSVSNGLCVLVSKIPVQGSGGRMYIPGMPESVLLSRGRWNTEWFAELQQDIVDWKADLNQRDLDFAMRRPDGTNDLVTELRPKIQVGRQDRRLQRSRV